MGSAGEEDENCYLRLDTSRDPRALEAIICPYGIPRPEFENIPFLPGGDKKTYPEFSCPDPRDGPAMCSCRGGSLHRTPSGWGYCPPINIDPRCLIRPRKTETLDAVRPTGAPYFAQDSKPSCPPHQPPLAIKGGFDYIDWLNTRPDREPPQHFRQDCIPTLCCWCEPQIVECCPRYRDPHAYTLVKFAHCL